jgi:polyhydroxybutyrate depolymerase
MARTRLAVTAMLVLLVVGCGSPVRTPPPASATSPAATRAPARGDVLLTLHDRRFTLHIPASYDPAKPAPLVMLLHGYMSSGSAQEAYLRFTPESDRLGFLYAYPDGQVDPRQNRYWNATDACCDLYGSNVDDSGYLSDVIKRIASGYRVDSRRVYLVGHSNGAFMAFRMACDHADQITAIAALNGAMWADASRCRPSTTVSVLDIRGTSDLTISYGGGAIQGHAYPSAARTDADWLGLDHCPGTAAKRPALDLERDLPGAETAVLRYPCAGKSTVETWTIAGGGHVPAFGAGFAPAVTAFLLSQAKP